MFLGSYFFSWNSLFSPWIFFTVLSFHKIHFLFLNDFLIGHNISSVISHYFFLLYQILSVNNNVSTKIFSVWFIILLMLHSIWQLNSIKIKTLFKYFNIFLKISTKYQGKVLFTQFIYSATQLWKWQYPSWNVSTKYFLYAVSYNQSHAQA